MGGRATPYIKPPRRPHLQTPSRSSSLNHSLTRLFTPPHPPHPTPSPSPTPSPTPAQFYAPWCGHCKRLVPIWDALSKEVPARGISAKIAKVDCTVARDVCAAHSIRGYPTLLMFKGGNKEGVRYAGPREVPSFLDFLGNANAETGQAA